MRFDWYSASVKADPEAVLGSLSSELGAQVHFGKGGMGFNVQVTHGDPYEADATPG